MKLGFWLELPNALIDIASEIFSEQDINHGMIFEESYKVI